MTTFRTAPTELVRKDRGNTHIYTCIAPQLAKQTRISLHSVPHQLAASHSASHGTDVSELRIPAPPRPLPQPPPPHQLAPADPIACATLEACDVRHFPRARVDAARDAGRGEGRGVHHLGLPRGRRHPGRRRPPAVLRRGRLPGPPGPVRRRAVVVHVRRLAGRELRGSRGGRRARRRHGGRARGPPGVAERRAGEPGHVQGGAGRHRVAPRRVRVGRAAGRHVPAGRRARPGRHRPGRHRVAVPQRARPRAVPGVGGAAVAGPQGAAAAADARGSGRDGGRRRGGEGRERQLHDADGGPGRGAVGERGAARDIREARRVRGDGGGEEEEVERDAGRRRDRRHGDHRPAQLRRRVLDLPHRHRRRERQGVHRAGRDVREHGGAGEAPGGGAAVRLGPLRLLPLRLRGAPGHALRALAPPLLPRLPRHRHRRLRLRQRRRRVPELHPPRPRAAPGPEELRHRAGPRQRLHEHRLRLPVLQRLRARRPPPRAAEQPDRQTHPDLPRPALEGLLPGGVHAVLHRRRGEARGVARVGGAVRARHALLRGVHEHGARRRRRREGQVAGVPRDDQPGGGQQLHRRGVHRGEHVVAAHRRQVHVRSRVLIHESESECYRATILQLLHTLEWKKGFVRMEFYG